MILNDKFMYLLISFVIEMYLTDDDLLLILSMMFHYVTIVDNILLLLNSHLFIFSNNNLDYIYLNLDIYIVQVIKSLFYYCQNYI